MIEIREGESITAFTIRRMVDEIMEEHIKFLRSPQMQAIAQQAIMRHPHYDGGAVSAYGFAGAALKAIADALAEGSKK